MPSPFDDFPTELVVKILSNLPYRSLLVVLSVSKRFSAIVTEDPELSVQLFKKLSKVYVESVDDERIRGGIHSVTQKSEPVRLHPAVPLVSYILGNKVERASFWIRNKDYRPHLVDLAIANDFVSIPVVTMMKIKVPDRSYIPVERQNSFNVVVKNPRGVRLIDFFRALAKESSVLLQGYTVRDFFGQKTTRATLLGDHIYYEGIDEVTKEGLLLTGTIWLGS
ncbi:F-box domain-containing protein [Mycena sanguinolenta]|uniref:F-box domain-containing protein n=1 Tax=Mycena sanguinolenta TaxID=230812 RepID=A0A8H6ZI04_9AGAR|nr:F-box domain-containing protein [Mycena sanguinolenta]